MPGAGPGVIGKPDLGVLRDNKQENQQIEEKKPEIRGEALQKMPTFISSAAKPQVEEEEK